MPWNAKRYSTCACKSSGNFVQPHPCPDQREVLFIGILNRRFYKNDKRPDNHGNE
jgi:hypothetical protein